MGNTEIAPQMDWTKDKLGIRDTVIGFANILKQEKYTQDGTSKVYSISAEFGIGKTFFCERLRDVLEQDNTPVSILNIWEMDFYENPLVPILVKLQETYDISGKSGQKIPTKLLKWFKSGLSGVSVRTNIPGFGEVCLDGKEMVNCNEKLNDKLQERDIYNEYKKFRTELNHLKQFLKNWTKDLDKPVVIIIDELDRCRPDYAVKTLEILKHFFDIPGLVFVLAIDEKQLQTSVKTLFGTENFDGYKRKFINNSFILPVPDKVKFTEFLYEKSGINDIIQKIEDNKKDLVFKTILRNSEIRQFNNDVSLNKERDFNKNQTTEHIIKRYFAAYSIWFKFTLRQMEQVFDRLVLFTKEILSNNELFSPDLAVFLVCLHEFDIGIYAKLRSSQTRIYGQHGGLLKHIYDNNRNEYSLARVIYSDKADAIFGELNRDIIPKVPQIRGFSTIASYGQSDLVIIHDDVDRFFTAEESQKHPLTWIAEVQNHENGEYSMVQNNGRIAVIINSKRNASWEEPPIDIDTASQFDLAGFRKRYFDKMDFISNFE